MSQQQIENQHHLGFVFGFVSSALKGSDLKPAIPTELSKHGYISANQSLRVNLRIHSHHQLFMLSNFCFMNSVLECQISKFFASFFSTQIQSRQSVVQYNPASRAGAINSKPNQIYQVKILYQSNLA